MLSVVVLHPLQLPAGPDLDHERLFVYWVAFAKK
jgi:hypothetical protein